MFVSAEVLLFSSAADVSLTTMAALAVVPVVAHSMVVPATSLLATTIAWRHVAWPAVLRPWVPVRSWRQGAWPSERSHLHVETLAGISPFGNPYSRLHALKKLGQGGSPNTYCNMSRNVILYR